MGGFFQGTIDAAHSSHAVAHQERKANYGMRGDNLEHPEINPDAAEQNQ
ncbi:hypothetical protein SF83666_a42570 (plasmid) [Sinorhizobium fredii CCBAU 83666]|nr:hypothetical protein SF83666_a42570 [Sinorhizobium fredii CCBAU 83666]